MEEQGKDHREKTFRKEIKERNKGQDLEDLPAALEVREIEIDLDKWRR